ncbi:MAG: class I SAM-dependent methyltransferase family protein [Thermoplasmata archaeon]
MLCLKVHKSLGEEVRKKLLDAGMLEKGVKIGSEGEYLLIPVKSDTPDDLDFPLVERDLETFEEDVSDYTKVIHIPDELEDLLPSSFEIIGDIAVIKIPDELEGYEADIGEAIIEAHKNVNTVLEDKGVKGDYRVREVSVIAGEEKTSTVHKEYGAEFEIDIAEAYFSPRLATERWRVVNEVKSGERVLDMFAGVGPYSILIGKYVDVEVVHAVDINPKAVELLKKNVLKNKVQDKINVWEGDAADIAGQLDVDRIIMNLPHSSREFVGPALESLDKGVIHYYEILPYKDIEKVKMDLLDDIDENGKKGRIIFEREVRTYSATDVHMAFDIFID